MKVMVINKVISVLLGLSFSSVTIASNIQTKFEGKIDASYGSGSDSLSWLDKGWGTTRFGKNEDRFSISRAAFTSRIDFAYSWSLFGVAQYVPEPKANLGITEAYFQYKPIARGYQVSAKVGAFYPKMSLENTGFAWSSPYTYNYSALNAWLGEEVRAIGTELTIKRPARRFRSKYDVSFHTAIFKGNDPAGTLIAWRGLLPHDRQTHLNERIGFAPLYSLQKPQLSKQWQYSDPFHEIDGRFGFYAGAHLEYLKKHSLRIYWYDNNADPAAINESIGQYAWDTKFLSVAWKSKLTKHTHFVAQAMSGSTAMGPGRGVDNNFHSWFLLLSHKLENYRFSARYEQSKVIDKDHWVFDPNASDNQALTLHASRSLSDKWQVGLEWLYSDSWLSYRYKSGLPLDVTDKIWRATVSYKF
ncbi:hypothetical protein C1E23_13170 [Pseudoalteromonas phenolica]|uniref:Porin n=2 Tax=Pseudoalteromonas phenolica TaxID=161398 RepID=A0A4Q7ILM9_9GAMM|nr:hypothetical protein C1E23_13170 [Pseudoalteromonas phenolica]